MLVSSYSIFKGLLSSIYKNANDQLKLSKTRLPHWMTLNSSLERQMSILFISIFVLPSTNKYSND